MRLPTLFLSGVLAALAMVSTGSNAHAAAMIQGLVTDGANTLFDSDWEHYTPALSNVTGTVTVGDTITTYILFTQIQNANGATPIGALGGANAGAFGPNYQLTAVATAVITGVDDRVGTGASQVADVSATITTSFYENAHATGFGTLAGSAFDPNRIGSESDAALLLRLGSEATSGTNILNLTSTQALSEDVLVNLGALFATTTAQTTDTANQVNAINGNPGGIGYVPNGASSTATDADETGGSVNFTAAADFAGTTKSTGNTSGGPHGNNSALQIVTNTTVVFDGVATTPEPSSMLIWAGLALAGGVYSRRRRGS